MQAHYLVQIDQPQQHHIKVTMKLTRRPRQKSLQIFLPAWSPGSYLIRDYARHVRWLEATGENGEVLYVQQLAKGEWLIDWELSQLKKEPHQFQVTYEIYAKELTVRTSHVDASHAWLHGPSYLMGVRAEELENPTIEFRFPPSWSKLSTALKTISQNREIFLYQARNYDELIDTPVEIGCHETDGFEFLGRAHHLAFYGNQYPHGQKLTEDIKSIVSIVAQHFKNELPYEQYLFINHFLPKLYGGLEHLNSTALQFDGRKLGQRKDYLSYLALVAHEYFHLWNVKRIRPQELGPFDYSKENYTTLLWLAEGLTSFMDDLFVYRAGLSTLEEYLESVKENFDAYYNIPGRKFHSLEQSSFNAWVKLYRPDENSKNSSISYYLKGGLVFLALHGLLLQKGKRIEDFLLALWSDYQQRPELGIDKEGVYRIIHQLAGDEVVEHFSVMTETTQEIDFETSLKALGLEMIWQESPKSWLGVEWEYSGERVFIKTALLDGPAYKYGLNAGDEIIFINGLRLTREDVERLPQMLKVDTIYEFIICRLGRIERINLAPSKTPRTLKEIAIKDRSLAEAAFKFVARQ
jgi:predicted metalloprotease with PDZ domain